MIEKLLNALEKAKIPWPHKDTETYSIVRWGKNNRYWLKKFDDGYVYGDFATGLNTHVFNKNENEYTFKDFQNIKKKAAQARKEAIEKQNDEHEDVANKALNIWNSIDLAKDHPYLSKKQVLSHGLKIYQGCLVLPLFDVDGKLWSLQFITSDSKRFMKGGKKKGCFFTLGSLENAKNIFVCEGYATAATVYETMNEPVVVAFDSGNLFSVICAIKNKYSNLQITICADNDSYSEVNVGVENANKAAIATGSKVIVPIFKNISSKPTDFNDMLILDGRKSLKAFLKKSIQSCQNSQQVIPDGFSLDSDTLFCLSKSQELIKISDYIKVIALTRELEEENAGRLVEFKDRHGKIKQVKIFDSWFSKDGSKIHKVLYKYGLDICTDIKTKNKLNEYLNFVNPEKTITYTKKSGWHGRSFLTSNKVYGQSDGTLIHSPEDEPAKFSTSGTLEDWKNNVAKLCINNSRLMLAVSASFASMIITPCGADSFFLHFYGRSSQGKTTMLDVAASVFGDHSYTRTWRMTDNALERISMAHNDLCLFLDEIGECDPYKIGDMAYMLVNGAGKSRATISGLTRKVIKWKLGGVSTGEEHFADVIKAIGKTPKVGQMLRVLSIPALPEGGQGLFEDTHNFNSPADFAIHLKSAVQNFHGMAFQAFVQSAIEDYDNIEDFYNQEMKKAKNRFLPQNVTGQDYRAFKIFATCGIGGLIATKYGITGWDDVDIMESIMKNYASWLENKGGVGSQEDKQALNQIRIFFEKYEDSRFHYLDNGSPWPEKINERAGYRTNRYGQSIFYVFKTYFEEVIAKGLDVKHVKNLLRDQEILETDKDRSRFDKNVKIRGKTRRMYVINSKIFGKEEND